MAEKMIKVRSKVPVSNGRGSYCEVGAVIEITEELYKKRTSLFDLLEDAEGEENDEENLERDEAIDVFLELDSVKTKEIASNIYEAGFASIEELQDATVEQLVEIKMIGDATAEAILEEVEEIED